MTRLPAHCTAAAGNWASRRCSAALAGCIGRRVGPGVPRGPSARRLRGGDVTDQHGGGESGHSGDEGGQAGELVAQRGRRPPAILPQSEWLARAAHRRLIASTGGYSSWAASARSRAPASGGRAVYESEPKYFYMDRPRLHGFYYVCPSHHPPLGWWCGTHGNTFAKFANLRKHLSKVC